MTGGPLTLLHGNALTLPFTDGTVSLIVTSPPYWALRSYQDGGEHFDGQLGSEPSPYGFLVNLWRVMDECWRVLRDDGSCWVNLGDKFAADNRGSAEDAKRGAAKYAPCGHAGYPSEGNVRRKSRMLLPHLFALGCQYPWLRRAVEHEAGVEPTPDPPQWIVRMDAVWSKPNGLPESVTDRVRASHEYLFHLVKSERYYAAVDEVREPHLMSSWSAKADNAGRSKKSRGELPSQNYSIPAPDETRVRHEHRKTFVSYDPLGKVPGSVWTIATEPLRTPAYVVADNEHPAGTALWLDDDRAAWQWITHGGQPSCQWPKTPHDGSELRVAPDHFAAFPSELPRRIILGWSPPGICTACGEGRRPVVEKGYRTIHTQHTDRRMAGAPKGGAASAAGRPHGVASVEATITGYACACPAPDAPTTPATIVDPFSGTGTTPIVAAALGRHGVGVELSADYLRLAHWRAEDPTLRCKVLGVAKPASELDGQLDLFRQAESAYNKRPGESKEQEQAA